MYAQAYKRAEAQLWICVGNTQNILSDLRNVMKMVKDQRRRSMVVLKLLVTIVTCMLASRSTVLMLSVSGAALPTVKIAKDQCDAQCGEVNVLFPFGIGLNCSLDEQFEIFCNRSSTPHRPFLKLTQWEVLNISDFYTVPFSYGGGYYQYFQVKNPISFLNCSEKKTQKPLNLTGMPFSFSSQNTFVAMSCGVLASIASHSSNIYSQIGCMSVCSSSHHHSDSASNEILCDGVDCCETSITDNILDSFEILFNNSITAANHDQYRRETECKFAFMIDSYNWSNYKNSSTSSFTDIHNMDYVPVTLYWSINYTDINKIFGTNMSPSARKHRLHYCDDYIASLPLCYCIGLRGNLYLIGGCSEDINECEEEFSRDCGPGGTCVNTYGDYHCSYKRKSILIGVGSALGALFLLFSTWGLCKFIKKRREIKHKQKFFKRNGGLLLQQQISTVEGNVQKTKLFNSNELKKATDNFSRDRILGQGGQGTVYKGMLEDGKIVAIKKSKMVDEAQLSDFINEVVILSQINHRNVVQLLGCCLETEVPLLVYEFISNGTLSRYIHERNEEFPFTWKMRLRVATEVSGALSYLHSAASFPIYHRDIKSTNILLDEKYRAKVADFGTSRTVSMEQTHLTTIVYGTFGYLDPEYFQSSQFTEKSDVYSFGVVLVELLTGERAISLTRSEESKNLATHFVMTMEAESVFDIIDPQVLEDAPKEEIMVVANLAQSCLNFNGRNRPTMKEVAVVLEGIQRPERVACNVQQKPEEAEYVRTDYIEPWDVFSTSTGSTSNTTANTHTPKMQELPLLSFE